MAELPEQLADLSAEARRTLLKQLLERKAAQARWHPLSPGQRTIWLLHQLEADSSAQNFPVVLQVLSEVDIAVLRRSLQYLVDRHPILRTTYALRGGVPLQQVHPRQDVCFETVDASGWSETELRERVTADVYRPFNLERGPVFRVTLFQSAPEQHVLSMVWHHIATDGWSFTIAMGELAHSYRALRQGREPELPPATPYSDFVSWQADQIRTPEGERHHRYWRETLTAYLPRLTLPTDRPPSFTRSSRTGSFSFVIDDQVSAAARSWAREWETTLFTVLLSVFQGLLYRYCGQDTVAVQTPTTGRGEQRFLGTLGFFVNQIVLAANLTDETSLLSLVPQTKKRALEAMEHQDYPLPLIFEHLPPSREAGLSRFSGVVFALPKAPRADQQDTSESSARSYARLQPSERTGDLGGLRVRGFPIEVRAWGFELDFELVDLGRSLAGGVIFNRDLFDEATVSRMSGNFQALLAAAVAQPDRPFSDLNLLSREDSDLIRSWNATSQTFSDEESILDLFEKQVRESPRAPAAIAGDERLTFQELHDRAGRLAARMTAMDVAPESIVSICLPRSLNMLVAIVAVVKTGAAYLPIDPEHPPSRVSAILEEASATVVISSATLRQRLPPSATVIDVDEDLEAPLERSAGQGCPKRRPEDLLYVLYTSGSTGQPKGVLGTHGATLNRLRWMWETYPWSPGEVACLASGPSFVDSVASILGPLLAGVPLVILDGDALLDKRRLLETLNANRVSRMTLVPSLLRNLLFGDKPLGESVPSLRLCACSGEPLPVSLARRFLDETVRATLLNLYGCSEAAGDSCCYAMKPGWNEQRMTIGRPIANTTIHILDDRGRPAPIGVPGEIYVGGKGLARGYLGLPELTRRCFTPRPHATGSDIPLYRTGDRGRYFADGTIEYLGRVDRQIQIRGHRTEPAEIEAVLGAHPAVTQAVVKPATSKHDETFLAAYAVPSFEGAVTGRELRAFVQDRLPAAMVPAAIVFMERLPLTSNGKVDTERLTAPERGEISREDSAVPPRSPLEEVVAAVWSQVLDLEDLGVHEHFFELGGHSLLATRAVSQLAETLRVEVPIRLIFEAPTVARFAAALEALPDKEAIAETAAAVVAVASLSDAEVRGRLSVQRDEQG